MSIAQNKKAFQEYEILEKFEAGIVLTGQEIKAIRAHRVNLSGGFCRIQKDEAWILNMHIANVDEPERSRKLLMHKAEIKSLIGKTQQKGLSLVPLSLYIKKGKAKLEIALARGKKIYDHREELKKRDLNRQTERELKDR
ncbi:SsrA-binding protein [Candidatus Berkelbacteria bacterium RBG_13_40_8]|uniref:SsrA-binding protein n=1 Tax=Candidatus Berkelbacteria bacterium RBG_13_40_8 TaxID=1797467 RepID=A0A1F5DMQ3_9BACT|nr:MAG: SsrA-binding protein [Candidatus Berkelbacteria bacterium RBG_13_40_8]